MNKTLLLLKKERFRVVSIWPDCCCSDGISAVEIYITLYLIHIYTHTKADLLLSYLAGLVSALVYLIQDSRVSLEIIKFILFIQII